jgi:predicted CoA-substrate-specific enzyme activase
MTLVAGIDVGSKTTKAVVIGPDGWVRGQALLRTRPDFAGVAQEALAEACERAGADGKVIAYVATTGVGRYNVPFRDLQITEITCAGRGAAWLFRGTRCVLDVGAQSTRAARIRAGGRVEEFKTNDKCAAGAGGFLERSARYLEVPLEELGEMSLRAERAHAISSVCAVLAESEIINHVTSGQPVGDIVRGIHEALAARAVTLLTRVKLEPELTLVGGVARQAGMVRALEAVAGMKVNVPKEPERVGALGAALLGMQRLARRPAEAQGAQEART